MTDKERKEFIKALQKFRHEIANDKAKSKKFLFDAGIITKKGKLSSNYKNLCIQPVQG